MRRYYILLILAIFLQACSGIPFQNGLFPPTDTPLPTSTATVTFTPSITPTPTITPTITPSPTIVHFPTQDPNLPTETFVPIPIFSGENTITPVPTATTSWSATTHNPRTGRRTATPSTARPCPIATRLGGRTCPPLCPSASLPRCQQRTLGRAPNSYGAWRCLTGRTRWTRAAPRRSGRAAYRVDVGRHTGGRSLLG